MNAIQSIKTLCLAGLLCSQAMAATVEETFGIGSGGTLNLETSAGSITVKTHASDEIIMRVETRGDAEDDFKLDYQVQGNDLIVKGKTSKRRGWGRNLQVRFEFTVPESYNLDLQTAGGSIDIDDINGNIDAHTSGGSISVGNVKGNVDVHTSGGSINTEAVYGELDAHTSGGSINVTFANQLTADAELNTSGGSITAYLIEDIQIELDASTSGGRVKSDFDINGRVKKQSIRGDINGGGPRLKLHTSGGSISIRSL